MKRLMEQEDRAASATRTPPGAVRALELLSRESGVSVFDEERLLAARVLVEHMSKMLTKSARRDDEFLNEALQWLTTSWLSRPPQVMYRERNERLALSFLWACLERTAGRLASKHAARAARHSEWEPYHSLVAEGARSPMVPARLAPSLEVEASRYVYRLMDQCERLIAACGWRSDKRRHAMAAFARLMRLALTPATIDDLIQEEMRRDASVAYETARDRLQQQHHRARERLVEELVGEGWLGVLEGWEREELLMFLSRC